MDKLTPIGLLLRLPADAADRLAASARAGLTDDDGRKLELEPLFEVGAREPAAASVGPTGHVWFSAPLPPSLAQKEAWMSAYRLMERSTALAAIGAAPTMVEPDLQQEWSHGRPASAESNLGAAGEFDDQDDHGGRVPTQPGHFAWHLDDEFSQLRAARERAAGAGASPAVRIAHLDTGYDPEHGTFPADRIETELQRNFVDGADLLNDARDRGVEGLLKHPGHGTATLAILAGGRFNFSGNGYEFDDDLGGAPQAQIVPIRVGNSVVQFWTSSIAKGISYAAGLCPEGGTPVDVISMSMGGVASAAWAEAVNGAYRAGVVFVAAAGNNFSGLPTRFIVFPARFKRVIAACGVMADGRPYCNLPAGVMQGCWGPKRKMDTAMSAYTPNAPWAEMGEPDIVDMNGEGTSAATPQVAAAAALYIQAHRTALFDSSRYPEGWMRVEAVRRALFKAAGTAGDRKRLGKGTLRAENALRRAPVHPDRLEITPPDRAAFAFLRGLTGFGAAASPIDAMIELEATQLTQRWEEDRGPNPFEAAIEDPDGDLPEVMNENPRESLCRFFEALHEHPEASSHLKQRADNARTALLGGRRVHRVPDKPEPAEEEPSDAKPESTPPQVRRAPFTPPVPAHRLLRGFSLDPSLAQSLDTVGISEMVFKVPWEKLDPGPRGEYVEVVDIDPASGCLYEPVDLDDPSILAQNGLPPSEGTPQFHQQMVYAAAMSTIENFEHALGRKALWRPGPSPDPDRPKRDSHFVRRLRIHPHALREANAYYSPSKIALLFGYFNAIVADPREHLPGGRVFSCLSHDIVAHETAHALLDGMHRRFLNPTNPDVRAFHEAFADIVALFQHFTFPEVLRHEIADTRGDIRNRENLFGKLAVEFGRGRGMRKALRDAIGRRNDDGEWVPRKRDPAELEAAAGAHERGGILVAAVFDAFLSIYDRRVEDLLRLATGGSGVLSPGAIHPDLVSRLAAEAAKAAQHVLTMCIRALDYCPPTDITFGDYLRAILTADQDVLKDDALEYRVAFAEAFRQRGIYPRDLRTSGVESLLWRRPEEDDPPRPNVLQEVLNKPSRFATAMLYARDRKQVFDIQYRMRTYLHKVLKEHFLNDERGRGDARFLGLELPEDPKQEISFEVHTARIAHRTSPDGSVEPRLMLGLLQERRVRADPSRDASELSLEGGCTVVAELRTPRVLYCIRKRVGSEDRVRRLQDFAAKAEDSPRSTYLGVGPLGAEDDDDEPFALLHRDG